MKVLIFGGTGLLGSEIALRLKSEGKTVKSVNRRISPDLDIDQTLGDIGHSETYEELVTSWRPEIVIQCAWVTDQTRYRNDPSNELYAQNTLDLAEHCFQSGTNHFVALGSSAEYGTPEFPCNATVSKIDPQDVYSEQKVRTYAGLHELADSYSRRLTWGRVFQPYGRRQDPARLIPSAARKLTANEEFRITNPDVVLDWITSRDVANAISYSVTHDLPEILDVGTTVGTSVIDVLFAVAAHVGADPSLIQDSSSNMGGQQSQAFVVSKESPLFKFGWSPQDDLASGLSWALSL